MFEPPATSCTFLPAVPGVVSVSCVPNCLAPGRRWEGTAPALRTLASIKAEVCRMARVPGFWSAGGTMTLNGVVIPAACWDSVTVKPGDRVAFVAAPAGKIGNTLLKVVGAVAMIVGGAITGGATVFGLSGLWWGIGISVAGMALSMAADFICPMPMPSIGTSNDKAASPTYSLNASSNNMRYGQPIPRIYGTYKVPPVRILDDYTELAGQDEYLNFLSVIGYGPLEISDIRIGGNALENFSDVEVETTQGWEAGENVQLVPAVAYQTSMQVKLTGRDSQGEETDPETWWVTRSIDHEVDSVSFDLQAPQGLYTMNDRAEKSAVSVDVLAQVRPQGGDWLNLTSRVDIPEQTVTLDGLALGHVYLLGTQISVEKKKADGVWLGLLTQVHTVDGIEVRFLPMEAVKKYHFTTALSGRSVTFSGGWYTVKGTFTLTGNRAEPSMAVRSSFGWDMRPYGRQKYDVRVRLKKAESTDSKDMQNLYLTAVRGTDSAAETDSGKLPLAKLAMRIKASNQLSGSLPVVTCLASSVIRDWNGTEWVRRASRNPASAFLDILTGTANERRKTDDQIDWESLEAWHEWCDRYGYTCDLVFDQQTSVWDALAEVASVGRGSTALMGGLWGAVWAHRQEGAPKGHITARNSRDFSSRKTYREPIHGLHVTYFDAANDYEETVIDVYAPGYDRSNASLFEGIDLTGITDARQAAFVGQFRLNQLLHLPEEYSATMPLEFMRLRKNDKVRVVRPEVLYGIGAALLVDWEEDAAGAVTALRWDSPLPMDSGLEYMACVRLTSGEEFAVTGASEDGLTFTLNTPAVPAVPLKAMNLVMVGVVEDVGRECLVVDVKPQSDLTASVKLQDYIPELYENDGGEVPPYDAHITLPGNIGRALKAPVIALVRSDEWALEGRGAAARPRLYVSWKFMDSSTHGRVEYRRVDADGAGAWMVGGTVEGDYMYLPDVEEGWRIEEGRRVSTGVTYDVRVQAVNPGTGRVSAWAVSEGHAVIGRTTTPANVQGFALKLASPEGIEASWTPLTAADVDFYQIAGSLSARGSSSGSLMLKPWGVTGTLDLTLTAVDALGLTSAKSASASIAVAGPGTPVLRSARLLDEGVVCEWAWQSGTWPVEAFRVKSGDAALATPEKRAVIPASAPFASGQTVTVLAEDIFGNRSGSAEAAVTIYPPKAPVVKLGADKLTGKLTLDWQDCRNAVAGAPSIARYDVAGTLANQQSSSGVVSVTGTHYEALVPLTAYEYGAQKDEDGIEVQVGTVTVQVTAVDKWGVETQGKEVKLSILPPYNPTRMAFAATEEGTSIVLTWRDCTRTFAIDYYTVYDSWQKKTYKVSTNTVVLPMRSAGEYSVTVQAFDVIGHSSAAMTYPLEVSGVGGVALTAAVDGADILLEWSIPSGTFVIDHYVIMRDNDRIPSGGEGDAALDGFVGTAKTNFFRVPAGQEGQYVYYVWAVDVAGNVSAHDDSHVSITVEPPSAPAVSAELGGDGVRLSWSSEVGANQLPVRAWDVVRQWDAVRDDGLTETREQDYGRLDVDTTTVPAFTAGDHTFLVRAVDSGGNVGPWGVVDFMAEPPGRVTFAEPTVIDNNVHLYWGQPSRIFFPIREYIFTEEEVYEDGTQYSMEIGRVDALFANQTEETAGTFTYGVTPVDAGGNLGEKTVITLRVSNPQGFKFFGRVESLFNGEKQSFVLDGRGSMLGPVPDAETWEENVDRVAGLTGLAADTLTHQQKVNAGYRTWLEPRTAQAVYVETTDHGALVPSSNITVSVTQQTLDGEPELTCKIEVSQDGEEWELVSDSAFAVYATSFRYSRVTLTVTGGYVKISGIVIDLNIKQLTDYGRSRVYAADARGTWIPFGVSFVDVNSLPKPNVLNVEGAEAFTVFEDVLNPQGFSAYVLDKNNARIDAEIDWVAYGV